jgi:hypothetical protein
LTDFLQKGYTLNGKTYFELLKEGLKPKMTEVLKLPYSQDLAVRNYHFKILDEFTY